MEQEYTLIKIPENKITAEELERQLNFVLPPLFQTVNALKEKVRSLEEKISKKKTNKRRTTS